jgi:hypothetical protein
MEAPLACASSNLRVYLGQTRSRAWLKRLESYGFGEMTVREEVPPRRIPFVFDNGAFKDWTAGRVFHEAKYTAALAKLRATGLRPDFLVVPDIVAAGAESLRFSLSWVERLESLGLPLYLVVQDGMGGGDVASVLPDFDGLFVGGSLEWKVRTGASWVDFAHQHGRPCHIGRVGTEARVRWARRIGADSIDSALPLWAEANFQRFMRGFSDSQLSLPEVA